MATETETIAMDETDERTDEILPFLDKLLENPLEFSLEHTLHAVSDATTSEPLTTETATEEASKIPATASKGMDNVFCGKMMSEQEMAQNGVGYLKMGGGHMDMGMVMYMDGFRFSTIGNQPCLNLYFPSWTLNTRFKFMGALLFVFLLSFAAEGISKFRHQLSHRRIGRDQHSKRIRQMMISALHGFQALLGYVVMLATMTFSIEILLAVMLGLSTGYYYYFAGEVGLEGHVTTNPCCSYMQDESDEHEQQQQSAVSDGVLTAGLLTASQQRNNEARSAVV